MFSLVLVLMTLVCWMSLNLAFYMLCRTLPGLDDRGVRPQAGAASPGAEPPAGSPSPAQLRALAPRRARRRGGGEFAVRGAGDRREPGRRGG